MILRLVDILISFVGLLLLAPIMFIASIAIVLDSGLPVFYKQNRCGRDNNYFNLIKFRTMFKDAHKKGLITVGGRDPRITRVGYYLRKLKLDELPQLLNVLIGEMSLVGPRPEVEKYIEHYRSDYDYLLQVRPGITSPASLVYSNENEILDKQQNPESYYLDVILPDKIRLDRQCVEQNNLQHYFGVIFKTLGKIIRGNR